MGGTGTVGTRRVMLDDGIEENEGEEEARVDEGEVDEGGGAEGVADSNKREWHLGTEMVDHVEKIARVISP